LAATVMSLEESMQKKLDAQVSGNRQAFTGMMHALWATEEIARQGGGTGMTKSRTYRGGSEPYHSGSFNTPAMAAQHNHANNQNTVGLGEFAGIMNGIVFRTRHNDYSLKQPSKTSSKYHQTEDVPRPDVPPSVLKAGDVDAQILEMRQYFKAFKEQDVSLRDYRPYFKPILCYLEGAWENLDGDTLVEPFESDRHHIAATGWADLVEKLHFFDVSGNKDPLENIPWLPTSVMEMGIENGAIKPRLGKWSYRILCNPVDGDVETARLRLVKDSQVRLARGTRMSHEEFLYSRDARFSVDPRLDIGDVKRNPNKPVSMGRNYLDLLMEQIPGKDNVLANLTDDVLNSMTDRLEAYPENDPRRATRGTAINKQHVLGPLNTGYYSRYFVAGSDAMGRRNYKRGYNDPNLFAAMTTHSEIANVSTIKSGSHIRPGEVCMVDGKACPRIQQRWTYAMPVELIYLTPLFNWNPHNIEVQSRKNKIV